MANASRLWGLSVGPAGFVFFSAVSLSRWKEKYDKWIRLDCFELLDHRVHVTAYVCARMFHALYTHNMQLQGCHVTCKGKRVFCEQELWVAHVKSHCVFVCLCVLKCGWTCMCMNAKDPKGIRLIFEGFQAGPAILRCMHVSICYLAVHMLSLTTLPERSTEDKSHGWAFQVIRDSPVLL